MEKRPKRKETGEGVVVENFPVKLFGILPARVPQVCRWVVDHCAVLEHDIRAQNILGTADHRSTLMPKIMVEKQSAAKGRDRMMLLLFFVVDRSRTNCY